MSRDVRGALRMLVAPTLALLLVVAFVPGRLPLALRVYALVVAAVALGVGLLSLRRAYPPAPRLRRGANATRARRQPPATLARLEDELALGVAGTFELHYRLAPRVRSIASGLLASRRRVSLDGDPEEARRILGEDTWELVRPGRPSPEDRLARGIPPEALARVVESLETV